MTQENPDDTSPADGMCQETSGFLFSHKCDRFSVSKCARCGKPLCDDHAHSGPDAVIACTSCVKQEAKAARQANQADQTNTQHYYHEHYYYNDPYFYGPRYYPGYSEHHRSSSTSNTSPASASDAIANEGTGGGGDFSTDAPAHDPMDFTEGDAESTRREEDADFETDMGAS